MLRCQVLSPQHRSATSLPGPAPTTCSSGFWEPTRPPLHSLQMTTGYCFTWGTVSKESPRLFPSLAPGAMFVQRGCWRREHAFLTLDAGVHGSAGVGWCRPVSGAFLEGLHLRGFASWGQGIGPTGRLRLSEGWPACLGARSQALSHAHLGCLV